MTCTRVVLWGVLLAVLAVCSPRVAAAQLPPEIMMDRHLLQAEQLMAEENHQAALDEMNQVVALQGEHGLALPDAFDFRYAQAAFSAGLIPDALESVNQYLAAAGRDGEFYRTALELLIEVESIQSLLDEYTNQIEELTAEKDYEAVRDLMYGVAALQEEHNFPLLGEFVSRHEQTAQFVTQLCAGQRSGFACWLELENPPQCYVWNSDFGPPVTPATWTGACAGSFAQGEGTLAWTFNSGDELDNESSGLIQDGKMHGHWVTRLWNGNVNEGPYVDGERHGEWVVRRDERLITVRYVYGQEVNN